MGLTMRPRPMASNLGGGRGQSGLARMGTEKSDEKVREVFPPLASLMVPARRRMARGSPWRLWKTASSEADQS